MSQPYIGNIHEHFTGRWMTGAIVQTSRSVANDKSVMIIV